MVVSVLLLTVSSLSMHSSLQDKKSAVGMILGSLVSTVIGIEGLALRSLAIEDTKKELLSWLPPNNASEDAIKDLSSIHIFFECCGLDQGYQDWGYNIPDSCLCTEESTNPCVAAPRHSSLYEYNDDDKPIKIYQEIFSTVLCILILCQLKNKEDVPAVVSSP
ncbi:hypothetical protein NQZ68_011305 [Dissostichus eleginoides]|nr:hypothetical protein NQZ68_011305 [Dissostichus eleginoides]